MICRKIHTLFTIVLFLLEMFLKFVIISKEVKKMQETGEIYLENILILSGKLENVRAIDIAERMNFLSHRSGAETGQFHKR
jgi:hypothetical protein